MMDILYKEYGYCKPIMALCYPNDRVYVCSIYDFGISHLLVVIAIVKRLMA